MHAYQSFQPGEVTPEQCHAIGVELARQVWGGRFQVLVATHMNTHCLHNHFVINAVSYVDGKSTSSAAASTGSCAAPPMPSAGPRGCRWYRPPARAHRAPSTKRSAGANPPGTTGCGRLCKPPSSRPAPRRTLPWPCVGWATCGGGRRAASMPRCAQWTADARCGCIAWARSSTGPRWPGCWTPTITSSAPTITACSEGMTVPGARFAVPGPRCGTRACWTNSSESPTWAGSISTSGTSTGQTQSPGVHQLAGDRSDLAQRGAHAGGDAPLLRPGFPHH